MRIDFNRMDEHTVPGMNGGTGTMSAKMHIGPSGKVIVTRIHPGGSIGVHAHPMSDDVNYVVSGPGRAVCDGEEEELSAGVCHVCRQGSEHGIVNTGEDDLVLVTVVVER